MADNTTQKNDDADEPLEKWQGHIKNIEPVSNFESEIKARDLPAQQQAHRAAEVELQNKALVHERPEEKPLQPAMPLGPPKSVYPDSDHGVESSRSQTPRFKFDTSQPEYQKDTTGLKSIFNKLFGR